ncbi:MAG: type II secretion system protein [Erysipelotrichaceae bacterium]
MNNKKGFTLIELIVVIAILGVLALILVPNFMGYLADAKETTAVSNARNAYSMAMTSAAKGMATPEGYYKHADVLKAVTDSYPVATYETKVVCDNTDKCGKVESVSVKSSGITVVVEKDKITVDGVVK